jgi:hypothetical protein
LYRRVEHLRRQDQLTHIFGRGLLPKVKTLAHKVFLGFLGAPEIDKD